MRLTRQILRKDIERLWPAVLLTVAMLIVFVFQEAARAPISRVNQAPPVSWLNLGLPFAWSLLIALVIHQDSLVGDRQFWVALPCGWRPLLSAKAAFIATFIQTPYFLATAVILLARGFNPLQHLPHLFWKQLVLLALILPAISAAALVKNIAQFMLLLITVASGVLLVRTRLNLSNLQTDNSWDVRWLLTVLALCVGAVATALLQFTRRYTLRSRAIGLITVLIAASLYTWLPRDISAAIFVAFSPVDSKQAPASVHVTTRELDYSGQQRWYNFQRTTVLIPLDLTGIPDRKSDTDVRLDQISLVMTAANGERFESQWQVSSNGVRANRIEARLENKWQAISFYAPAVWNRINRGPVTIHGRILESLYRFGMETTIQPGGRTDIAGLGRCSMTSSVNSTANLRDMSILECESVDVAPGNIRIAGAFHPIAFNLREHAFYGPTYTPQDPWLSPLRHGISISGGAMMKSVAPQTLFHTALIDYTMPNVDLNAYVVHKPVKPEAAQ